MSFARETRFLKSRGTPAFLSRAQTLERDRAAVGRSAPRRAVAGPTSRSPLLQIEPASRRVMLLLDSTRLTSMADIVQRRFSLRNLSKAHGAAVSVTTTPSDCLRVDGKRARFVRIPPGASNSFMLQIVSPDNAISALIDKNERGEHAVHRESVFIHAAYIREQDLHPHMISNMEIKNGRLR